MSFRPQPQDKQGARRKKRVPWLALLLLLGSVYLFWILPMQMGSRPVQVEFVNTKK